jgi:tRNA(Ile)-lysidine synthetase-like protein
MISDERFGPAPEVDGNPHGPEPSEGRASPASAAEGSPPPVDLVAEIRAMQARHALWPDGGFVVVAVSGGADSVALLDAMCELVMEGPEPPPRLHVAHLDHGLRPGSVDDAAFVARLAEERGLPATLEARNVAGLAAREGEGLPAAARRVRYAFLAGVARQVGAKVVMTGHHRDDQAETVLMALLRGAGLDGLSGMRPRSSWPLSVAEVSQLEGPIQALPTLARPLLAIARADIEAWCAARDLVHRRDPSNEDTSRLRGRVRHTLLPALEVANPRLRLALARTAEVLEQDRALIDEFVDEAWSEAALIDGAAPGPSAQRLGTGTPVASGERARSVSLSGPLWRGIAPAVRGRLVRRAVAALGGDLRTLGYEHVAAVCAADDAAASGAPGPRAVGLPAGLRAVPSAEGLRIERSMSRIPPPRLGADPVALALPGLTRLPGGWAIEASIEKGARRSLRRDPWLAQLDADAVGASGALAVRGRRPGDRFQPLGMGGRSKSLQDFFVDARVPAPERDGWPLVVAGAGKGERIVWIPGHRVDERVKQHVGTRRTLALRATPPARLT